METNRLIAKFMGMTCHHNDSNVLIFSTENGNDIVSIYDLKYHSSWDWLMHAVDKIEGMTDSKGDAYRFNIDMCNVDIEGTDIQIIGEAYKIVAVYRAVVEFINLYNNQEI